MTYLPLFFHIWRLPQVWTIWFCLSHVSRQCICQGHWEEEACWKGAHRIHLDWSCIPATETHGFLLAFQQQQRSAWKTYLQAHLLKCFPHGRTPNCARSGDWTGGRMAMPQLSKGVEKALPHLQSKYEEADLRIPLHLLDWIENEHSVCVVITSDTDVIVALLFHMPVFLRNGLEELWVRAGVK